MALPPLDTIVASVSENSRMKDRHVAVPVQFKHGSGSNFPNKPPAFTRSNSAGPMNNVNQKVDPMTAALMARKQMARLKPDTDRVPESQESARVKAAENKRGIR